MTIDFLKPGDCLLYRPADIFGWIISLKTWNRVSHVEVFRGSGMSYASRNGLGVNLYPLRRAQLTRVLRPKASLNMQNAENWFKTVQGQKYDWMGLLVFSLAVKQGSRDKMFCSEFATRWYRYAETNPVSENYDADRVAPADFLKSPAFDWVWDDGTDYR